MHPVGSDPTTLLSSPSYGKEEMSFELGLIGTNTYNSIRL